MVNGRFDIEPLTDRQFEQLLGVRPDADVHEIDIDGLGAYLVVSEQTPQRLSITGLPLEQVNATLRDNIVRQSVIALSGLAVIAAVGALAIRRELRPLGVVVDVANDVTRTPLDSGAVAISRRSPIADPHTEVGQVGAALNTMLDHIEEALAAREDSEKRARTFLADASHELRTPLTSVAGYTELLQTRDLDSADQEVALERIAAESTRMSNLVEDMLLLARLDSGRPLNTEPVALPIIATEALMDAQALAPDHAWSLDLPEESDSDFTVIGDEARLRQVLANLLTNARLHTPPGTNVTVRFEEAGTRSAGDRRVIMTVDDDGPGIPAHQLGHVFDRFARGDASRRRDSGTSGLGLPIVAAIVEALDGGIEIAADNGTIITVSLPSADSP